MRALGTIIFLAKFYIDDYVDIFKQKKIFHHGQLIIHYRGNIYYHLGNLFLRGIFYRWYHSHSIGNSSHNDYHKTRKQNLIIFK
jgi:hypothetical protein